MARAATTAPQHRTRGADFIGAVDVVPFSELGPADLAVTSTGAVQGLPTAIGSARIGDLVLTLSVADIDADPATLAPLVEAMMADALLVLAVGEF